MRPQELVEDGEIVHPEAGIDEDAGIAHEARWIARHRDHPLDDGFRQHARLHFGACARRIEHHRIEGLEVLRRQGRLVEIARQAFDPAGKLRTIDAAMSAATAGLALSTPKTRAFLARES